MKKILYIGTSKGTCELIKSAKKMGLYTIVTDPYEPNEFNGKAKLLADEYWMIDTSHIDELETKCREENIDGISSGISQFNINIVIELSNRLNLPIYCTKDAWHYTMNKYDFKALCRENNVPVATDYFVSNPPTEDELNAIKFPVMVKAVDQSANKGMSYCYKKEDIIPAIEYAHTYSQNEKVVIERMLHGTEFTAYYALANGEATLVNLFSDLAEPGTPGKCYAVNCTACNKLDLYLKEVDPYFRKLLKNGGMTNGVCWIELMLDEDGHFYVIEMGYRMSGDMMAIPIRDACGFDSYKWMNEVAIGIQHTKEDLPKSQISMPKKCGCSYILWSKDICGEVTKIEGLDKLVNDESIQIVEYVREGDSFRSNQYLITFLFTKENANDVCEIIEKINNSVKIYDTNGNDIVSRFTDFDTLKELYYNQD